MIQLIINQSQASKLIKDDEEDNQVFNNPISSKFECKQQQLTAMGNRLLDWFSVIMADTSKRRKQSEIPKGNDERPELFVVHIS